MCVTVIYKLFCSLIRKDVQVVNFNRGDNFTRKSGLLVTADVSVHI